MTLHTARNRILATWVIATVLLLIIVVAQGLGGKYGDEWYERVQGFWWVAQLTLSILTPMVTVSVIRHNENLQGDIHNLTLFHLCVGVSIVYLVGIAAVPLLDPFINARIQDLFRVASIILTGVQPLVVALILKFFLSN